MQIVIARKKGFCFGVKRAVQIAFREGSKKRIFSYGDLIHNPQVVEFLKKRGISMTEDISLLNEKDTILIRAHGITPREKEKIKKKGIKIIDATCPRVLKVQSIVKRCAKEKKEVIIIGDKKHSEVKGLMGYAENRARVVETEKELLTLLKQKNRKFCLVSQTTQNRDKFEKMKKIAKKFGKDIEIYDTICEETDERQEEVKKLSKICDAVIVVGGKNSANTKRLAEIVKERGKVSFHIETEKEIPAHIKKFEKIGVTAGASTPNWLIQRVVYRLEEMAGEKNRIKKFFLSLWRFFIRSYLYVAFSAASLCYACSRLLGIEPSLSFEWITASYIFAMHLLNHLTEPLSLDINYPAKSDFYRKHRKLLVILGTLGVISSLGVSWFLGIKTFGTVLLLSLLGLLYRFKISFKKLKYRSLSEIPGSKDIFLALAWASMLVILNIFSTKGRISGNAFVVFLFAFSMAFSRSLIYSLRDLQGDMMTGVESIPTIIGEERTKLLGVFTITLTFGVLFLSYITHMTSILSLFLLINLAYYAVLFFLPQDSAIYYKDVTFETIVDGNLVLSFIVSYVWFLVSF